MINAVKDTTLMPAPSYSATIVLSDAGKRYNRDWIFRKVTARFEAGTSYAITGPNGSGKSTLLQAIAGSLMLTEGNISYTISHNGIERATDGETIFQELTLVAPYLELIEEMTAKELLNFHQCFKALNTAISIDEILRIIGLEKAADKQIRFYSSGMKQRLKLAQAVFSNVPILLLDEPCTNLDASGYELYHELIQQYCREKLIIVSSNDAAEMDFCKERIAITAFK